MFASFRVLKVSRKRQLGFPLRWTEFCHEKPLPARPNCKRGQSGPRNNFEPTELTLLRRQALDVLLISVPVATNEKTVTVVRRMNIKRVTGNNRDVTTFSDKAKQRVFSDSRSDTNLSSKNGGSSEPKIRLLPS